MKVTYSLTKSDREIKAGLSNFGTVPYGFNTQGRLYYYVDNEDKELACKPMDPVDHPNTESDHLAIILVERGSCSFVTKVRNIQRLGGHIAIIIDNRDEELEDIIMGDDGTGSDITIPSVLIKKIDGDKLTKFFEENKNNTKMEHVHVSISFKIVSGVF